MELHFENLISLIHSHQMDVMIAMFHFNVLCDCHWQHLFSNYVTLQFELIVCDVCRFWQLWQTERHVPPRTTTTNKQQHTSKQTNDNSKNWKHFGLENLNNYRWSNLNLGIYRYPWDKWIPLQSECFAGWKHSLEKCSDTWFAVAFLCLKGTFMQKDMF